MDKIEKALSELTNQLLTMRLTIATAESCTGGLVAALLTEQAGSSQWFERGFVTYSNLAKQELLSVENQLLELYGAVSIQVAEAMALGALQHSCADVSLAVTGIAGPDGGTAEKPVGTVCFAFAKRGTPPKTRRCFFPHASRKKIRQLSCLEAIEGMRSLLIKQ